MARDAATLVVDGGSWSVKCGLAGDDRPRVMVPASVGIGEERAVGKCQLAEYDAQAQVKSCVENGSVVDWAAFEDVVRFAQDALLGKAHDAQKRFLFVEPHNVKVEDRERLTEMAFEKLGAKDLFACKSAPLNLYACARSTGVVLDVGGDSSAASVVIDGFLQRDSVKSSPLAGKLLTQTLLEILENDRKIQVNPKFCFTKKVNRDGTPKITYVDAPAHPTYLRYWKLDLIENMIHQVCKVSPIALNQLGDKKKQIKAEGPPITKVDDSHTSENHAAEPKPDEEKKQLESASSSSVDVTPAVKAEAEILSTSQKEDDIYTLPDGTQISAVSALGNSVAELLLDPKPLHRSDIIMGLAEMVTKCAQSIPNPESRRDVLANVVLCGGPSAIPGLSDRIAGELAAKSRGFKSRVIVGGLEERKYNAWIGGSIIGTLSSLSDLWVTRQEYEEHGPKALNRKCP